MTSNQAIPLESRRSNRLQGTLFFLAAGLGIGAWASSLPLLAAGVGLNKGELGLVLLCFALGAIVLMINVGRYIDRVVSNETLSLCGGAVFGATFLAIPFIGNPVALGGAVLIAGAAFGTLDVAMNTGASRIEQETGRHLMSSFHAVFSIGNLAGALLVGQLIGHGGGLLACLGFAGMLVLCFSFAARLIAGKAGHTAFSVATGETEPVAGLGPAQRALIVLLGTIAFLALLAEGGMMDWTAIYMIDILGHPESHGAYAFAIFAAAMAAGRLVGDALTRRAGHVLVIRAGGLTCAASIAILVLADNVVLSFATLALCGFGVANMVPAVFASAGRIGGRAAGRAISIVTTMGYSGLLLGPALLGFLAQATSLVVSFVVILLAFLVIAGMTVQLSRRLQKRSADS
jgi:MFS family permease